MPEYKKQQVHFILDRSGSMNGKIQDMIGGLKANIEKLKEEQDFQVQISIKLFDDKQEIALKCENVQQITDDHLDMILANYTARGSTSLRDALGDSIVYFMTEKLLNVDFFCDCVIYVMTDGMENTSNKPEYFPDKLKEIIRRGFNDFNIKIFYVGSNQDSILSAQQFGIPQGQAINYSESNEGITSTFRSLADVAQRSRSKKDYNFTEDERAQSIQ